HRTPRSAPHAPRGSVRGGPGQGRISPRAAEGRPEQPDWEGADGDGVGASKRGRGGGGRRPRGCGGPAGDAGPDRRSKEWEERRRQNIEKMNEEMEKIAEYERSQRDGVQEKNPVRNFLDDPRRSGPFAESDRREGSRRHIRNWGGADFDKVKTGMEQGKAWPPPGRGGGRRQEGTLDMTLSMTGRERAEYIRWKQEREQIDRERLARHRQATGEWRREWDAEKMDTTFKEGAKPGGSPSSRTGKDGTREVDMARKGRGRGRARGTPSKPYSMHDNRWEEEEELEAAPVEAESPAGPLQQEEPPASLQLVAPAAPEEDEDQWEDVSEGEEEEEEGSGSQGAASSSSSSSVAEEDAPRSRSPEDPVARPPGRDGPLSLAMPSPELEAPSSPEAKPLTPFSLVEGYRPVSDWGEEMELVSPRTDCTKSLLAPLAEVAVGAPPPPGAPVEETGVEEPHVPRAEGGATPEPGEQGAPPCLAVSSSGTPGGTAEIPDAQQRNRDP
ncbi:PREDICTED: coiled-coil domain-containing protein 9, partial [Gekko japonicus]|uniref:Coiled-coil domain-containing protein 9 n=1 Tax=Gekko japonicus TaxID=146911 RepID=A0ABM1JMB9_GEKJA